LDQQKGDILMISLLFLPPALWVFGALGLFGSAVITEVDRASLSAQDSETDDQLRMKELEMVVDQLREQNEVEMLRAKEREQEMADHFRAKEQEMADQLRAKEQEMADQLRAKEQEMTDYCRAKELEMADQVRAKEQEMVQLRAMVDRLHAKGGQLHATTWER
jgi:uncharacterized protein YgiM (DUF1202 family)